MNLRPLPPEFVKSGHFAPGRRSFGSAGAFQAYSTAFNAPESLRSQRFSASNIVKLHWIRHFENVCFREGVLVTAVTNRCWRLSASAPEWRPCWHFGSGAQSSTADGARCAGRGGSTACSSNPCVVFVFSLIGLLGPPMMPPTTPDRDVEEERSHPRGGGHAGDQQARWCLRDRRPTRADRCA